VLPEAHRAIRETKVGKETKEDKDIREAPEDQVPRAHKGAKAIRE